MAFSSAVGGRFGAIWTLVDGAAEHEFDAFAVAEWTAVVPQGRLVTHPE